jgi:hypothetical protein
MTKFRRYFFFASAVEASLSASLKYIIMYEVDIPAQLPSMPQKKTNNSDAGSRRVVLIARYCTSCADPQDILKVQIALFANDKETKTP